MPEPTRIPRFVGMNNRLPDFVSRAEESHFLRNAVNVDLTNAGTVKRRKGTTSIFPATDGHSLWSFGPDAYYVDFNQLIHVAYDPTDPTVVYSGLTPGRRMSYCLVGAEVVASNGQVILSLAGDAPAISYTLPVPALFPALAISGGGSLPGGLYQIAMCYRDGSGRLGGATPSQQVEVAAGSRISVDVSAALYDVVVYMSPVNGDQLFAVYSGPPSVLDFGQVPKHGHLIQTQLQGPMPPGILVRYNNGRLYSARGSILSYSEAFAPTRTNPARNYIPFPAPIVMIEPVDDGLYVAADQTYFLQGDPSQASLNPVLPYSAVPFASGPIPNSNDVWWMSQRGACRGSKGGQVANLVENNVVTDAADAGAALYREEDGMRQMIATLFGARSTFAAARSYMEAEVIRKEVDL